MNRLVVIGAGTMGHGIAQVAAVAGLDTALWDADSTTLQPALTRIQRNLEGGVERGKLSAESANAAVERIRVEEDLSLALRDVDLVIEAIVEDLGVKQKLFSELDKSTEPHTVLATNTSSLSVKLIAEATRRPGNVVGMHFFNPVHIMKLVEIVRHETTSDETISRVTDVAKSMGKQPILVKDSPGFASSRLGIVLGLEAMRMIEQGVASAQDIDKALELGYGHPMGPLKVSDLVGLDVRLSIAEYLYQELGGKHYDPPTILRDKVAAGELGKKSGKGFYDWSQKK